MTPPEWLAESQAQMERFHQTGRVGPYEKEYFLADGSRSWMLFAGRDVGDGTIAEYCNNINDRKQMEKALRENQEQLQALNQTLEQKVQQKTAEVRRLASDLIKATQRERQRISHVLHDDLQQRIYAIQMQLTFMHDSLHDESARSEASEIKKELDDILKITRHLSIDLSPPILRGEGLSQAVHWLAGWMQQQYELPIEVQASEAFVIPDEELHVLLFNCVRELLFNVVKHAEAHGAVVILEWIEGGLRIEVHDDGRGLPPENLAASGAQAKSLPPTIGLPAIHHQLSLFGGSLHISSQAGSSTQAILRIPLH
jgi:signal transduction histidine kinase